jgi:hypothetical protein
MSASVCQIAEARKRVLGTERADDPPFPSSCSGDKEWHNFRTFDSGDPVPFFLCETHRSYLRNAKQARIGTP